MGNEQNIVIAPVPVTQIRDGAAFTHLLGWFGVQPLRPCQARACITWRIKPTTDIQLFSINKRGHVMQAEATNNITATDLATFTRQ